MTRVAALLLLALLAFTASKADAQAHRAWSWTPAQIRSAVTVADAQWPASPCRGREQLVWVNQASLRADQGSPLGTFGADADQSTCTVHLDAWMIASTGRGSLAVCPDLTGDHCINHPGPNQTSAVDLCGTLTHEFGHLAGYVNQVGVTLPDGTVDHDHSPNPLSVMSVDGGPATVPCVHAFPAGRR